MSTRRPFPGLAAVLLSVLPIIMASSCAPKQLRQKISELNLELDNKNSYVDRFNSRMDSLRMCLKRDIGTDSLKWETAYSLFSAYSYVNVDSTKYYLGILGQYATTPELQYRSEVCRIRYYGVEQDYNRLVNSLQKIDPSRVSEKFRQRYFDELQRSCVLCPGHTDLKKHILRTALESGSLNYDIRMRYEGLMLLYDEQYREALPYFEESYKNASNDHVRALASYNQAFCHRYLGDDDAYCLWLAQAAIYDIKVPVSEYLSLLELSDALFSRGEYEEASRMIQVVMNDAIAGNWSSRIHLSASSQKSILEALDISQHKLMHLMMAFILVLLVFITIVSFLLFYLFRQNRNLRRLNETVTEMNSKLKDEGRIKESYLFKYMEMSVEGIGHLEEYRHKVRQTLKEEGADALMGMLRAPRSRADYKEFYANFDSTFLSLYPDFIKEVNKLMKEDFLFKEGDQLNTDLRILATIRLGFNDSGQIARFLNIPSTSVYTRRSAIIRNSTCNKGNFDIKLRQIT